MKAKAPTSAFSKTAQIVVSKRAHTATAPAAGVVPVQLKVKRILVPFDFSRHAQRALDSALAIAGQFGSEIILANIVEDEAYPVDSILFPAMWWPQRQEENLTALKEVARKAGPNVKPIVRLGRAWIEVVRIAAEMKADLIVIATHGRTGLKHILIGSVAERIVQHAPCLVLTIQIQSRGLKLPRGRRAANRESGARV